MTGNLMRNCLLEQLKVLDISNSEEEVKDATIRQWKGQVQDIRMDYTPMKEKEKNQNELLPA